MHFHSLKGCVTKLCRSSIDAHHVRRSKDRMDQLSGTERSIFHVRIGHVYLPLAEIPDDDWKNEIQSYC